MLSEPRAVLFHTELQIPPIEGIKIDKHQVRALYNKMCEPGGYAYENLDLQAETPTLSTRRPNGESICRLGGHRLIVEERNPEVHVDSFVEIVQTVLKGLGTEFPPFMAHRVRIECLAQPNNSSDAIDLLASKVANVHGAIEPFERPPSFFGVRFRFYPKSVIEDAMADDDDDEEGEGEAVEEKAKEETVAPDPPLHGPEQADPADEAFIQLRFESYSKDASQVWMEVSAQYIGPLAAQDVTGIGTNIRGTYRFLAERGKRFLDQFDTKTEEGGAK